MKTKYDIELIAILKQESIELIEDTESIIKEIETVYTLGTNGINWIKNGFDYFFNFKNSPSNAIDLIEQSLREITNIEKELLKEDVIVIGDALTELGYKMSFQVFLKNVKFFLNIPQHTYVWIPTKKKCLNITFENEVFY